MNSPSAIRLAVLSAAAALTLAACGQPDDVDLVGVKPGMTLDEAQAVAPSGSTLYCRGDGDTAFDQISGLPLSTSAKLCTWTDVDSAGKRSSSQIVIGGAKSLDQILVFDQVAGHYALNTFLIELPVNAQDQVVKDLSDKRGSPMSMSAFPALSQGVHWSAKDGTLTAGPEDFNLGPRKMLVVLKATNTPRS